MVFPGYRLLGLAIGVGLCSVLARGSYGQSPAEPELLVNSQRLAGLQLPLDLACLRNGNCAVLWDYGVFSQTNPPVFEGTRLWGTTILAGGGKGDEVELAEDRSPTMATIVPAGQRFGIARFNTIPFGSGIASVRTFQWFDRDLRSLSSLIDLSTPPSIAGLFVQAEKIPGGFVQLNFGYDTPGFSRSAGVFLLFFDESGGELRPPVRVNPETPGEQEAVHGGLAVDLQAGTLSVVYHEYFRDVEAPQTDVFYRRFSLAGEPLTPAVRANSHVPNSQALASIAKTPNGGFVSVWSSYLQDGSYSGIFGRRFKGDGSPLGPDFPVNQITLSDQLQPQVASNAAGDFVVVWKSFDPSSFGANQWDIKSRLYHADGRPAGPEVYVNLHIENSQEDPLVAFAPNGTFVAAWSSNSQVPPENDNLWDVFARRFSASRADEPCLLGDGGFRCDTGRTGGTPEVVHVFGGPAARQGFLGDVDGDGREDPCVYSAGNFRCDADHEGGLAEVRIRFTVDGAPAPLLGDMDGDGRADPCLYGGGRFSCDTRHDGGTPELRLSFGKRGETPLLGDVDGDRRAEACAWADGLFRCDTGHDGGNAEWTIRFGQRGDQPLLGDFDGDGRDDPCVYRGGTLLCDTGHNGGAAEGSLAFGGPGDRLAVGNLDGL